MIVTYAFNILVDMLYMTYIKVASFFFFGELYQSDFNGDVYI